MPSGLYPAFGESVLVVYDLRDAEQWSAAGEARRAWGREHAVIHTLTSDHVVIEFRAGGALVEGGRNRERKGDGWTQ